MSNPFTQYLLEAVSDPDLAAFVRRWDGLEDLVIQVYRGDAEPAAVTDEFNAVQAALIKWYPRLSEALTPFWQRTKKAGAPTAQDPFAELLSLGGPDEILENWPVLQALPPAREALNLFLQAMIRDQGE